MTIREYLAENPHPDRESYENTMCIIGDVPAIEDSETVPEQSYVFCSECDVTIAHFIDGEMLREWEFVYDKNIQEFLCVDCSSDIVRKRMSIK